MTVVWVVVGAGLLVGLLVMLARRRLLTGPGEVLPDNDHPWSIDVRRGEVRIPRQQ